MTFPGKPGTVKARGFTIDSRTYWATVSWRFFAKLAAVRARLSSLGPTLPLAPAGANVWQALQPADAKTCFPFGGPPPPPPIAAAPFWFRLSQAANWA